MRNLLLIGALLASSTASAGGAVYYPNIVHSPDLGERNDTAWSMHFGWMQFQASGAWAVTDFLAVRAQADGHPGVNASGDVGVSLFHWIKTRSGDGLRLGLAADVGRGAGNAWRADRDWGGAIAKDGYDPDDEDYEDEDYYSVSKVQLDPSFRRVSVQAELAWKSDRYEFGGVYRVTFLDGSIQETFSIRDQPSGELAQTRQRVSMDWMLVEPVAVLRMQRTPQQSLEMQLGLSIPSGDSVQRYDQNDFTYNLVFALGLSWRI